MTQEQQTEDVQAEKVGGTEQDESTEQQGTESQTEEPRYYFSMNRYWTGGGEQNQTHPSQER